MSIAEEKAKNESLKATLAALKAPKGEAPTGPTEAQKKAALKLKIIEKEKQVFQLQQKIDKNNMEISHLQGETKSLSSKLQDVQSEIEHMRNAGKAVWETVGFQTIEYKDPYHTGLSKRTPTGERGPAGAISCPVVIYFLTRLTQTRAPPSSQVVTSLHDHSTS